MTARNGRDVYDSLGPSRGSVSATSPGGVDCFNSARTASISRTHPVSEAEAMWKFV